MLKLLQEGIPITPIYNAVMKYSMSNPGVFHMPGHKLGRGIPKRLLSNLAMLDVTEIPGTDNLHAPEGAIREAQELAAKAFGADHTFFLVNGSTCGIHAAIMTICSAGDKLIVGRDCHRSVIGGMTIAGITPVFIKPEFNSTYGISTVISPLEVEEALSKNPDAVGVMITRPNYYGVCSDIEKIAEVTHSFGKILMVDEAHGAHLKFSSSLPVCAMDAGADICVQSAHKTLPAFTQGSYLHIKGGRIDVERLRYYLSLLETSSPSYIIMAFLDIAREIMEKEGGQRISELLSSIKIFEKDMSNISGFKLMRDIGLSIDPTRVVINTSAFNISGYEIEKILRENYKIQAEMSDVYNIVCIATIADQMQDFKRLSSAISCISEGFKQKPVSADINIMDLKLPLRKVELKDVSRYKYKEIRLCMAEGRISAQMIIPYPPGIAVACPGEVITGDMIDYINDIKSLGGNVIGLNENDEVKVLE